MQEVRRGLGRIRDGGLELVAVGQRENAPPRQSRRRGRADLGADRRGRPGHDGRGRALQLILSGEIITAQEAYRIGLVNEVVPAAELITRAEAILKQVFANAPLAVKYSLEAVNKGLETSQAEGLSLEASLFGLCAGTEDKKEGTQAFLQKRAAQFQGR